MQLSIQTEKYRRADFVHIDTEMSNNQFTMPVLYYNFILFLLYLISLVSVIGVNDEFYLYGDDEGDDTSDDM